MDKSTQTDQELDLQVVELGDAKELTMGIPAQVYTEDNPQLQRRFEG
ncbi:rubrivinodin family lasso peptide [Roseateles sp.]